jgi:hypothetical protein
MDMLKRVLFFMSKGVKNDWAKNHLPRRRFRGAVAHKGLPPIALTRTGTSATEVTGKDTLVHVSRVPAIVNVLVYIIENMSTDSGIFTLFI